MTRDVIAVSYIRKCLYVFIENNYVCCILGKIAAGNLTLYLPFLLKEIQANPKRQYLLLHSLKEVCNTL